jgi:hypothetical protein
LLEKLQKNMAYIFHVSQKVPSGRSPYNQNKVKGKRGGYFVTAMKRRSPIPKVWRSFYGFKKFCEPLPKKDRARWFKKLLLFNSNELLAAAAIKFTGGHFPRTDRGYLSAIGAGLLGHNFGFFHFSSFLG